MVERIKIQITPDVLRALRERAEQYAPDNEFTANATLALIDAYEKLSRRCGTLQEALEISVAALEAILEASHDPGKVPAFVQLLKASLPRLKELNKEVDKWAP